MKTMGFLGFLGRTWVLDGKMIKMEKKCICCGILMKDAFAPQKYCNNCSLYVKDLLKQISTLTLAKRKLKVELFMYKSKERIEDAKKG